MISIFLIQPIYQNFNLSINQFMKWQHKKYKKFCIRVSKNSSIYIFFYKIDLFFFVS